MTIRTTEPATRRTVDRTDEDQFEALVVRLADRIKPMLAGLDTNTRSMIDLSYREVIRKELIQWVVDGGA